VFIVWITVGFFEGFRPIRSISRIAIQVGAEDDRSAAAARVLYRPIARCSKNAWDPVNKIYDYKKFVQYRKTIQ